MSTLGQLMQATAREQRKSFQPSPEDVAALQAAHVKQQVDALTAVVEQAKTDIVTAIASKKSEFDVFSRVFEKNPAYEIMHAIHSIGSAYWDEPALKIVWNDFKEWAFEQDLRIELLRTEDWESGKQVSDTYIRILARPIGSRW
jgi:hypothetical protein